MSAQENTPNASPKDDEILKESSVDNNTNFDDQTQQLAEEGLAEELPSEKELEDVLEIDEQDDSIATTEEASGEKAEPETTEETTVATKPKEIPKKDYKTLDREALLAELRDLILNAPVQLIKEHVEEIKQEINTQFDAEEAQAKEAFLEEGGNIIDFRYFSPMKKSFSELYYDYRSRRSRYYQSIRRDQQENLKERQAIIDELKSLKNELGGEDSLNNTYNKFKNIQERWHNAGNIPRDRYNLVWNTYHHHVDNFYEFLHLNREFRDKHFKENLNKKLQIIARAEELAQEKDVNRAFKELQLLHRMWKDEIGPVSREYSDEIWEKFSAITKKIHDARQEFFKQKEEVFHNNLVLKKELIEKIKTVIQENVSSHNGWQQKIKEIEALRESFFKIGRVPKSDNEETWNTFKEVLRTFNHKKNDFYKSQKREQYENLNKKLELIKVAEEHKDSEDFETTTALMKKIQDDWKRIGRVPRKDSDKVWKQFKEACNHYFNRIHAQKNKASAEEETALTQKEQLLEEIKGLSFEGDTQKDLAVIKSHIEKWKTIGRVPYTKKGIEQVFNKLLDELFKKLDVSRKEVELIKYENKIASMSNDNRDTLNRERSFILKKIDEVKSEINQLENNLGFFQYVSDDNPMVKEVHKNIKRHKDTLELWQAKLRKLKSL